MSTQPERLSAAVFSRLSGMWVVPLVTLGVTALVCLPFADGLLGVAGILLALGTIATASLGLVYVFPQLFLVLLPASIPAPMLRSVYFFEAALMVLMALMLLHGWRTRAPWLQRVHPVEAAFVLWMGWALFTGCWSEDARWYFIGVRKFLVSLCSIWVALRLSAIASRRWFNAGLVAIAILLSLLTHLRFMTTGLSAEESALRRPMVTDLGWGRSNYLAAILVVCTPSLLHLLLRGRPVERWAAGVALVLVTSVQLLIASRGALGLFLIGTLVYLLSALPRHRLRVAVGFAVCVLLLYLSPMGEGVMSRMLNLRELGSMTIRIWFVREGWERMVDHLPWGMGLWQGFGHADKLQGLDPHNYPLLIGGDLGIPGLLLWGWVNFVIARSWWRTRRDERSRDLSNAMLLTLALANVNSLVEPTFPGPQFNLIFYWVLAGTLSYVSGPVLPTDGAAAPVAARARPTGEVASEVSTASG